MGWNWDVPHHQSIWEELAGFCSKNYGSVWFGAGVVPGGDGSVWPGVSRIPDSCISSCHGCAELGGEALEQLEGMGSEHWDDPIYPNANPNLNPPPPVGSLCLPWQLLGEQGLFSGIWGRNFWL